MKSGSGSGARQRGAGSSLRRSGKPAGKVEGGGAGDRNGGK